VRRSVLLVLSVALAVLVFAPVAAAQSDDVGADDRGMGPRGTDDRGMDNRGFDDRGMDHGATASPASSASARASSTSSSASASPASSATSSPTPAPSNELPDTGGVPLVPMLSAMVLALLVGSAAVATILMRRTS
jgi:hypothetical protein